jgi:hypothetical protein
LDKDPFHFNETENSADPAPICIKTHQFHVKNEKNEHA